jgi:hypothetical protein
VLAANLRHPGAYAISKEGVPCRVLLPVAAASPKPTDEAVVMALIGISVGETFEYVLDRDPCKKTVEVPIDPTTRARASAPRP